MHSAHTLVVTETRHRELVAEADAYRRAALARRAASEDCRGSSGYVRGTGRHRCRPYVGRRASFAMAARRAGRGLVRALRGHRGTRHRVPGLRG